MTRDSAWYRRNDDYLGAAMMLVRHRLNVAPAQPAAAAPAEMAAVRRPQGWLRGLVGGADETEAPPQALPPPEGASNAVAEDKRLMDALEEAGAGDPPPALVSLANIFDLSTFEQNLLMLALAVEFDPRLSDRMPAGGRPTLALAMSILPDPAWGSLAPDAPLRDWRLVEIERGHGEPLTVSPLSVDERILNHVKGLDHIDASLVPLLKPLSAPTAPLPESQRETVAAVATALDPSKPAVAVLRGADRASIQDVAAAAAAEHGLPLFRLAADALPTDNAELDRLARLWHREWLLAPAALLVDAHDPGAGQSADSTVARAARFVGRSGGGMVIAARDGIDGPITPLVDRIVARPTGMEQLAVWQEALGDTPDAAAAARRMAGRFDIDRAGIAAAARAAQADRSARSLAERLDSAALARTRTGLARLAERIEIKAAFGDIVLPQTQEMQLRQIVAQLEHRLTVVEEWGFGARMNRGLGISALFAGESGTGKTMAAEVVAGALGLDLYRIDLSAVVSKYIGETEKNLARLFDAADLGGAVLLFDEADALFGKRSEVKDAHDRFANIEIDYLLQRIESYRGVAILTTNMKHALDPAFMRRLRFLVEFPYPGSAERRQIWERAFPPDVPREGIDLDRLSRLDLNGASIQSVVLNAAFLAAARNARVTTDLLIAASRSELQKLGRPVNEGDFRAPATVRSIA
ncbi:MAG TPA: ATP-binding protein [Sphingomonas sp.]|nr:ATP-binding protein [Sphingomonas sp.]